MFSSNAQARLSLPAYTNVLHLEFANYFFPASDKYEGDNFLNFVTKFIT